MQLFRKFLALEFHISFPNDIQNLSHSGKMKFIKFFNANLLRIQIAGIWQNPK